MKDIRQRLLAAFQIEYRDHLEYIRSALARLEAGEQWDQATLDEVFRRAHSLKGAARAVDLKPVEAIAHRLETLFGRLRDKTMKPDPRAVAVAHDGLNAVEDWVVALDATPTPAEPLSALATIDALLAGEDAPAAIEPTERPAPPPVAAGEPPPEPDPPAAPVATPHPDMVRISTADLDRLLRTVGQLLAEGHGQDQMSRRLRNIELDLADLERNWKAMRKSVAGPAAQRGEGPQELFSHQLHGLVRAARTARSIQQRSGWTMRQLATNLQDEVRLARMVPAEGMFGGFRKMMRDLARDEGKELEFRARGLDVRADRMVLQTLKDSVMHMLRNSLFHGIEAPEERLRSGKDRVGHVELRLEVAGNRLVLTIEDDGRGIDVERIIEVGVAQGVIREADLAGANRDELARHIFRPGFSTAQGVTDLAGRGMGMSVVYQAVARLNGSIDMPEKPTAGALFRVTVPLSIATHRLLLVSCLDRTLAIPSDAIEQLARIRVDQMKSVEGRPVAVIDDCQIPLYGLAELLDLPEPTVWVREGTMPVAVLRSSDARIAVAVDSLIGIRDGLLQDLGFPLGEDSKVSGGTLLEDGSVVLVVSSFALVETCRRRDGGAALNTAERSPAKKVPAILVVDDSFTTRTLEKSILQAHGYRVLVAVDGLEALTLLRSQPVDLVVADIEMPRLDGFGLLKEMKRDATLAALPVVMVTSLESREDRERGLGLGADAYVVKRKFDQRDLLETIEQLL